MTICIRKLLCVTIAVSLWTSRPTVAAPPAARGPIENPGMRVVADDQGAQALGYTFDDRCAKPSPWQASWIWVAGDAPSSACFRKPFTLNEAPKQALAWMTADIKYRLWINGKLVSRGPVDQGTDYAGGNTHRWFYDFRDLTPFFHAGPNVIAAEVFARWTGGSVVSRGQHGLLFEAQVDHHTIKSDTTWRAASAPDLSGWEQPGFDDGSWPAARTVEDVWSPLVASEIPPLMEARYPVLRVEGLPPDKVFRKAGQFQVVFNRLLCGYPQIRVTGGKGATVDIQAHYSASFVLDGTEQTLEFPDMSEIDPAFTVQFKNVTSPITVLDAGAVFTSQPVEYRGAFECSDPELNRIWKARALGGADLPADASPGFTQSSGTSGRAGRLCDPVDGD